MLLRSPRTALESTTLPEPRPQAGQLLVKVGACGVCRTDLHVVDGELSDPRLPLIPGHEIVGTVAEVGADVDAFGQRFAREMGAAWAGGSDDASPAALDAALLFAPVGSLVPKALRDVAKGGTVICAGIHMSDIPQFPYALLWGERHVLSVANLTRRDGIEFMEIAQKAAIRTSVTPFPLSAANDALRALRGGALTGAAVLTTT